MPLKTHICRVLGQGILQVLLDRHIFVLSHQRL